MPQANRTAGLHYTVETEHRDGHCSICGTQYELPAEQDRDERWCNICYKYTLGKLIWRHKTVEPPTIKCVSLKCYFKYTLKAWHYILLMMYHKHRIAYAVKHRHDDIPDKYRTGEDAPKRAWGLFREIIRLQS